MLEETVQIAADLSGISNLYLSRLKAGTADSQRNSDSAAPVRTP